MLDNWRCFPLISCVVDQGWAVLLFKEVSSALVSPGCLDNHVNMMERNRKASCFQPTSVTAEARVKMSPLGSLLALFEGPVCHCIGLLM